MLSMHYSEEEDCRMGANLAANYVQAVAMVLFVIGFANLLLQKNLLKKIIG